MRVQLYKVLAAAWAQVTEEMLEAYPNPTHRRTASAPAYWLTLGGGDVLNVGRLPTQAQKALSKGPMKLQARVVEAELAGSTEVDAAERLELFAASKARSSGSYLKAQPWMDDGDLHFGNSDMLTVTALWYALDPRVTDVPRWACPCGWVGVEATGPVGGLGTSVTAHQSWMRHAQTCPKGAGKRAAAHDALCDIVMVMLRNAGYLHPVRRFPEEVVATDSTDATLRGLASKPDGHGVLFARVQRRSKLLQMDREETPRGRAMAHACMHGMISDSGVHSCSFTRKNEFPVLVFMS